MKTLSTLIIVIIVIAGGWFLLKGVPASAPATDTTVTDQTPVIGDTATTTPPAVVTILYGDQGFSPQSTTVSLGTTVEFVNKSSEKDMWVASAMHPTHAVYGGTSLSEHCAAGYTGPKPFDQCAATTSFTFTFLKAGTWKYHNHTNAQDFGTIIVTEGATVPGQATL